jgi:nucleoside 2-deoxyribosyltransferase
MKEILILGSLPKNEDEEELYETIISVCEKQAEKVYSPIDTAKFEGNNLERFERALKKVEDADLIIGEQTNPSTGQGIEIGYAIRFKKPIIIVAKEKSKVSGLIKGCPLVKEIIYYESIKDLKEKLLKTINLI